jgi:hypothetical protein
MDSLFTLAFAVQPRKTDHDPDFIDKFARAYIKNGSISRNLLDESDTSAGIFSNSFVDTFANSDRAASRARDYILATVAQQPWYSPPAGAKSMDFGELFHDLYQQAAISGHGFTCRITRSMTESGDVEAKATAWLPSKCQPEPSCLGDLLKLLGGKTSLSPDQPEHHFTTGVGVSSVSGYNATETFELVERAMRFQPQTWRGSYLGGELSKYGSSPEDTNKIDFICARLGRLTSTLDPPKNLTYDEIG